MLAAMLPLISTHEARTLLLSGQGLLEDPARRAGPAATQRVVDALGYVQLDSINAVARAHDLTLAARIDGYEPHHLKTLLEQRRSLFEHWTHDASAIPAQFLPHWRLRFQRFGEHYQRRPNAWRRLGPEPEATIRQVLNRIRREGPLLSRDFDQQHAEGVQPGAGWWNWGAQKAALEYLWRTGRLMIRERRNFQKVYDLRERVFPQLPRLSRASEARHVEWACSAALDRLGAGTPAEIGQFFGGLRPGEVGRWCEAAVARGRIEAVRLEGADGSKPRAGYATPDWRGRVSDAPSPPERIRLLSPFDPVVRDRKRLLRLFDFDYRIEVFVPAAKRRYGYYVLPILEGERLLGRLDPKLHRDDGVLEVRQVWWEQGVRPTRARMRALADAVERTARLAGAERIVLRGQ
jgi:uncharacterized protein YcaQ